MFLRVGPYRSTENSRRRRPSKNGCHYGEVASKMFVPTICVEKNGCSYGEGEKFGILWTSLLATCAIPCGHWARARFDGSIDGFAVCFFLRRRSELGVRNGSGGVHGDERSATSSCHGEKMRSELGRILTIVCRRAVVFFI